MPSARGGAAAAARIFRGTVAATARDRRGDAANEAELSRASAGLVRLAAPRSSGGALRGPRPRGRRRSWARTEPAAASDRRSTTRPFGLSTWRPRRRRDASHRTIRVALPASSRRGRRRRDQAGDRGAAATRPSDYPRGARGAAAMRAIGLSARGRVGRARRGPFRLIFAATERERRPTGSIDPLGAVSARRARQRLDVVLVEAVLDVFHHERRFADLRGHRSARAFGAVSTLPGPCWAPAAARPGLGRPARPPRLRVADERDFYDDARSLRRILALVGGCAEVRHLLASCSAGWVPLGAPGRAQQSGWVGRDEPTDAVVHGCGGASRRQAKGSSCSSSLKFAPTFSQGAAARLLGVVVVLFHPTSTHFV